MAQLASTPTRRVRIWVVLVVTLALTAAFIAAYLLLARRDMAALASNLRPAEAAAIAQELEAEGVAYEVADDGTTLLVPADLRDAMRLRIAGADLAVKGQEGFELFDSSELGLTEFAQRIKYQRALQGELARTIMKIDGVTEARIHISIPEQSVFRSERSPPKAAVTLLTRSRDVETPEAIAGIQQLVSAAIPDLNARDVVVLNGHGAVVSTTDDRRAGPGGLENLETAIRAIAPGKDVRLKLDVETTSIEPGASAAGEETPAGEPVSMAMLSVVTSSQLATVDRDRITGVVLAAQLPGIVQLENIRFDVSAPVVIAPPPAIVSSIPQSPAADPPGSGEWPLADGPTPVVALAAGLVFVLTVILLGLFAMRRRGTRLSLTDQRKFAERLRVGLEVQSREAEDGAI